METTTNPTLMAVDRARAILDPSRVQIQPELTNGYINVLKKLPPATTVGARAMRTGFYPVLYERLRPVAFRLASGLVAPGRDGDRETLRSRLALTRGAAVLDIGCGPGNFTGYLGDVVGNDGLAIGLDASDTMLAKAIDTNSGSSVAYVRGDAERLPFADESFDAASCLAALYLMNDPYAAIREAVRVLKPGGRFAIMTSFGGNMIPTQIGMQLVELTSGIRSFDRMSITSAFADAGLVKIEQRTHGVTQAVWARKPDAPAKDSSAGRRRPAKSTTKATGHS